MNKPISLTVSCRQLTVWLTVVISLIGLSLVAMVYWDKSLYLWFNRSLHHDKFNAAELKGSNWLYDFITAESSLVVFVGFILLAVVVIRRLVVSKKLLIMFSCYQVVWLLGINYFKILLKYFFGRCVPSICFLPDVALLTNQYGFVWFSKVSGFASFPSGHCTFMSFCLFWVAVLNSKLKFFIVTVFLLLFCGLVIFNYHFLSDCLAGTALGLFWGGLSYWLWCYIMQHFKPGYQ
ncbi:MAG: phosphatase PAP2 family protein [Burkholderiales bacterium]|nr:phosphatase PAP2 family protein [Burkholderiales bacterium]